MIEQLAQKAGDSVWRKVGEKAVMTAVTTLVTETIKATVEVLKKAKLREQKADFDDRRARDKKASEPDDSDGADEKSEAGDEEVEETDVAGSDPEPDDDVKRRGPKVDFASYVARKL